MLLNLLVSLCCALCAGDTLEVATVSVQRNAGAAAFSPVQSVSERGIGRLGVTQLHEVLAQFSGISIKDYGGVGGLKTVSVRNMGAAHTSIVYEGIAVSDAQNGQTDISRFSLDDIAHVSMSIGAEDDIFCSARLLASAGVLRIESSMPSFTQGPLKLNARITADSFGTVSPHISLAHSLGDGYALKASANGTFSQGSYPFSLHNGNMVTTRRRINSDVTSFGAEAGFFADWDTKGRLRVKAIFHDSDRGLPGPVILYTQNAYERLRDRSVISNVMYDYSVGNRWKLHVDAGFTHSFNRHTDANPAYPFPQDSRYSQNEYSMAARCLYSLSGKWSFSFAEDIFVNDLHSNIPECPFPIRLSSISALSGCYSGHKVKITASVAGTAITETVKNGMPPKNRFRLSPIIGLSWNPFRGLHLRTSCKEGFRVPTFNDLYYARVGNVNLKPETARQINAGAVFTASWKRSTIDISADAYYNYVKDKITAIPTMFIWKMRNTGKVAMYGTDITLSATTQLCRWLMLRTNGNYSLQYALDITDSGSKSYRHQIPYTPRHCGSCNMTFETPWLNLSLRVNAVGRRYSGVQNTTTNELASYADHSVCINRSITFGKTRTYTVYLALEGLNLSGDNYEIIRSYPMPGRSYRLTLKFQY